MRADDDKDDEDDACTESTLALRRACMASASDEYWVAIAKCENLSDPKLEETCEREAKEARRTALEECAAQQEARLEVCEDLGEEPYDPSINPANFVDKIDNPYFPLKPGTVYFYEGKKEEGIERIKFHVTTKKKVILGVRCVVVRDTVTLNGQVIEDTEDWFAQDKQGNVWYFGEISQEFENGELVSLHGSWKAGVDGAKAGIIMKAHPKEEDLYRQEFAPSVAEDLAEVLSVDESGVKVPFGTFNNCLVTRDFTPISPGTDENKYYAPGVGNVLTIDLDTGERMELVLITAAK